jgi:hypothetical protein
LDWLKAAASMRGAAAQWDRNMDLLCLGIVLLFFLASVALVALFEGL